MNALDELLNEIEKHSVMRAHGSLMLKAAAELADLRKENDELKRQCGVPLGYHEEDGSLEWCGEPAVTGICPEHWNEFMGERARAEKAEAQLRAVVAVLCETRGHEGKRPCKFCSDMFLAMILKEAE